MSIGHSRVVGGGVDYHITLLSDAGQAVRGKRVPRCRLERPRRSNLSVFGQDTLMPPFAAVICPSDWTFFILPFISVTNRDKKTVRICMCEVSHRY